MLMMRGILITLVAAVILGAFLFGMASYVSNLDEEIPSATESEKKGRGKYLIDSRWPFINLRGIFNSDQQ